jgi:hypothetical protein
LFKKIKTNYSIIKHNEANIDVCLKNFFIKNNFNKMERLSYVAYNSSNNSFAKENRKNQTDFENKI